MQFKFSCTDTAIKSQICMVWHIPLQALIVLSPSTEIQKPSHRPWTNGLLTYYMCSSSQMWFLSPKTTDLPYFTGLGSRTINQMAWRSLHEQVHSYWEEVRGRGRAKPSLFFLPNSPIDTPTSPRVKYVRSRKNQ